MILTQVYIVSNILPGKVLSQVGADIVFGLLRIALSVLALLQRL